MTRYLISIILLCLAACSECYAGYTVAVWQQPTPQHIPVYRVGEQQLVLNPGTPPERQATFSKRICDARDIHSSDPLLRSEVWEDSAGTAVSPDLFAACPQIRTIKEAEIRAEGVSQLSAMAKPYSAAERETWATQQREARAWLANHNADVPMIFAMATVRGLTIEQMVGLIMENVELFEFASGYILGKQQKLLDRIAGETDFSNLLGIAWE